MLNLKLSDWSGTRSAVMGLLENTRVLAQRRNEVVHGQVLHYDIEGRRQPALARDYLEELVEQHKQPRNNRNPEVIRHGEFYGDYALAELLKKTDELLMSLGKLAGAIGRNNLRLH